MFNIHFFSFVKIRMLVFLKIEYKKTIIGNQCIVLILSWPRPLMGLSGIEVPRPFCNSEQLHLHKLWLCFSLFILSQTKVPPPFCNLEQKQLHKFLLCFSLSLCSFYHGLKYLDRSKIWQKLLRHFHVHFQFYHGVKYSHHFAILSKNCEFSLSTLSGIEAPPHSEN